MDKILSSAELDAMTRRSAREAVCLVVALMHACPNNPHIQERACAFLAGTPSRTWDPCMHMRVYVCVVCVMSRHPTHRGVQEMGSWVLSKLVIDFDAAPHGQSAISHGHDNASLHHEINRDHAYEAFLHQGDDAVAMDGDIDGDATADYESLDLSQNNIPVYTHEETDAYEGSTRERHAGKADSRAHPTVDASVKSGAHVVIAAMRGFLCDARVQERACAALGNLASGGAECKESILALGGAKAVVCGMHVHEGDARVQVCGVRQHVCVCVCVCAYVT